MLRLSLVNRIMKRTMAGIVTVGTNWVLWLGFFMMKLRFRFCVGRGLREQSKTELEMGSDDTSSPQKTKDKLQKSMVADSGIGKSIVPKLRSTRASLQMMKWSLVFNQGFLFGHSFLTSCRKKGRRYRYCIMKMVKKYLPHWDYFQDEVNQVLCGHMIATILMYLSNVNKGGETIFPHSEMKQSQLKTDEDSYTYAHVHMT